MTRRFDLVVIGAGSGGVRAARLAAEAGAHTALIERDRPGGTCVLRGCIPKKLMVQAAGYAHVREQAAGFGWRFDGVPTYDHGSFVRRLQGELTRLSGLYTARLEKAGVELIRDEAVFEDSGIVRLNGSAQRLEADRILIASGGRPRRSGGIAGSEHAITSDEFFTMESLPASAVVIGGGYIAVELAGVMAALGVRTSLVYRGQMILRGFDCDVRKQVQDNLIASGVEVITEVVPDRIAHDGVFLSGGQHLSGERVLLAIGRDPATAELEVDRAGIALAADGSIRVDDRGWTGVEGIWAIGDVTNRVNLTPVAIREAEAFVRREFMGQPDAVVEYDCIPTAVFSMPPAASVGLTQEEAKQAYGDAFGVHSTCFRPLKATISGCGDQMFIKLIVRSHDDMVLGCHIVGEEAAEIIQAVAIALRKGVTGADFARTCALHPTSAEELVTLF